MTRLSNCHEDAKTLRNQEAQYAEAICVNFAPCAVTYAE